MFVSPLAKKLAEAGGLDLSGVTGSGPNNRIIRDDVEAALHAAKSAAPAKSASPQIILPGFQAGSGFLDIQNSNIRKVIAERLSYSKQNIPHYYVTIAVNVDNLKELYLRKNLIGSLGEVRYLVNLRKLRVLGLSENPISNIPMYRLYIIKCLP